MRIRGIVAAAQDRDTAAAVASARCRLFTVRSRNARWLLP